MIRHCWTQLNLGIREWIEGLTGPEQKKTALQSGFWPRIAHSFIHIIPIGATGAVLYLTISQTYWTDPSEPYTQTKLQALQFAAKLYEVFICASLASIIFSVLRRDLVGNDGVSFGSLVSAFNFTQLSTVFSAEFWMGFGYRRSRRSSVSLLALLSIGILLATAAGPSAAIAVIPRLGWWNANPFGFIGLFGDQPVYTVNLPLKDIWPDVLDSSHLPSSSCREPYNLQAESCPGLGYESLLQNTLYWQNNADMEGFGRPSALEAWNITALESSIATKPFSRPLSAFLDCYHYDTSRGEDYGTLTSTPTLVIAASPFNILYRSLVLSKPELWERSVIQVDSVGPSPPKKPFVQVMCIDVIHDTDYNDTGIVRFPNHGILTPPFSKSQTKGWNYLCESWNGAPNFYKDQQFNVKASQLGDAAHLKQHMDGNSAYLSWVDFSQNTSISPSITAAVQFPLCNHTAPAMYACTIDARWLPTRYWTEPTADTLIHTTGGDTQDFFDTVHEAGDSVSPHPIRLGLDWLDALNTKLPTSNTTTTIESLLTKMYLHPITKCGNGGDQEGEIPAQSLEAVLGFVIVDGLARVGLGSNYSLTPGGNVVDVDYGTAIYNNSPNSYSWVPISPGDLRDMPLWSNVTFSCKRYGYGYGFGTATTAIALAILCLHALVALAAILKVVVLDRTTTSGWDAYGHMFALAWKSHPPTSGILDNAGVGIRRLETWKERVVVRVAKEDGDLQLIFRDEDVGSEYGKLRVDEAYG